VIILGDNPFFGVNHASANKSRDYFQSSRVLDWSKAHVTMHAALESGISTFMVSTHAEAPSLIASMREDAVLRNFEIIPAVPYLHRVNHLVGSKGIVAASASLISYTALVQNLLGGASLTAAGLSAFIDKEIEPIAGQGFAIPAIALQNIFVDMLLGLGLANVISEAALRQQRAGRRLIAITMNPIIADRLLDPSITLCTHYNYLGYMVQPDLKSVQSWLATTQRDVLAMGVLSSGRGQLTEVMADPVLSRFSSVVVGASRPTSIRSFAAAYAARG
jgi:hypothetical protein